MKRLLVVVVLSGFSSGCGGAIPLQAAPGIQYPRGGHISGPSGQCSVSRIQHSIDTYVTCDYINRR